MINKIYEMKNSLFEAVEEVDLFFNKNCLNGRLSVKKADLIWFNDSLLIDLGRFGEIELSYSRLGDVIKKPSEEVDEFIIYDKKGDDIMRFIVNKGMDI